MKTRGRPRHPDILTPRQQDVLALIRRGLTNDEIADRLGISPDGVKFHVSEILRRLHVDTRHEAAAWRPEPDRPRSWLITAPLAFGAILHHGWPAKLVAGAALAATVVLIGLLTWGVVTTPDDGDHPIAATGDPTAAAPQPPVTGIAEVDAAIRALVAHDIDGVMRLVELAPIGCSTEQIIGSPPSCPAGQPDGTPVDAFGFSYCEGAYATSLAAVRGAIVQAFSTSDRSSIYAVLRDNSADRTHDGYYIVETPGAVTSSSADVRFWYLAATGKVQRLQSECGPRGAAQQTAYRFPINPGFVYGPENDCTPGDDANLLVTVEAASPGGIKPQFWGPASSTLGTPTGTRAIVTIAPGTIWSGDQQSLEQVLPGVLLEPVGRFQSDCTILAGRVFAALSGTPATGPPLAGTITGQILQDVDGNRDFSLADRPARTLVQLISATGAAEMYTAVDGTYRFANVPDGSYTLRLWWTPGFFDVSAPGGVYDITVKVDVSNDAPVSASAPLDSTLWVAPAPDGVLPFPADEVAEPATIATGTLNVGNPASTPAAPAPPPSVPTAAPSALTRYVNPWWGIEVDYPSNWIPDPNYGGNIGDLWTSYADPAGRDHGYIYVTLLSSPSLDVAVDEWAHHKLRPFGGAPLISGVHLAAGDARLILPDPGDPSLFTASILMPLPARIDGQYDFFELDAHRDDIMRIAQSLTLTIPASAPSSPPASP